MSIKLVEPTDELPLGADALAATGDVLLTNSQVLAVVDAIDHPHYLAPSGGSLIDLATRANRNDSLTHVLHATGLLPRDAAHYTSQRLVDAPTYKALILTGQLDGQPGRRVATRYEIKPCDPGIRVRTEVWNGDDEAAVWMVADGFFWGGRSNMPFTPAAGRGFVFPSFDLLDVDAALRDVPFVAATLHGGGPATAYVEVNCDGALLQEFDTDKLSAVGSPRRVVQPRDYEVFERYIGVADGSSVASVADLALELRRQLHGEAWTTLKGALTLPSDPGTHADETLLDERGATVLVSEGTSKQAPSQRVPWSEITPGPDGLFELRVPTQKRYVLEVNAFGRKVFTRDFAVELAHVDVGEIELPAVAGLRISVTIDEQPSNVWVFLQPADEATRRAVEGKFMGSGASCAPLLGPVHGGSPACNRLIAKSGVAAVSVLPGRYEVYAFAGPFRTLARQEVDLTAGTTTSVRFALDSLDLQPAGTLSADLHLHAAGSFDASIPPADQIEASRASDLDVVNISDHNIVQDYASVARQLGFGERPRFLSGVETTGLIPFEWLPSSARLRVVGHWSFWSLPYVADAPYRGAPWDQLVMPGVLFTKMMDAGLGATGVIQLNHPWSALELGRDLSFPSALGLDTRKPLRSARPGTVEALFDEMPEGSRFRNSDYHVQEVMSGTDNERLAAYRAFWFYLLNQGIVHGGTANSDSHGLVRNMVGSPRNLVTTRTTVANFDQEVFNADVRAGHILGTNGPLIEASIDDVDGEQVEPSVTPFVPAAGARLRLRVKAAPWIPVEEVRIVVNGAVVRKLVSELAHPSDPFGTTGVIRYEGALALDDLLRNGDRDAWLVVEAGQALEADADLDCNGIPDTGDNNGDGEIDWRDVDWNEDEFVDSRDAAHERPTRCDFSSVGPLKDPSPARDPNDPRHHFEAVQHILAASLSRMSFGYPAAFTNPLILDRDGQAGFKGVWP